MGALQLRCLGLAQGARIRTVVDRDLRADVAVVIDPLGILRLQTDAAVGGDVAELSAKDAAAEAIKLINAEK